MNDEWERSAVRVTAVSVLGCAALCVGAGMAMGAAVRWVVRKRWNNAHTR